MKPQHVIALVVVAVLATVVIEELRISKMRAEIIRLQAIPRDDPSDIARIVSETEEPTPAEEPDAIIEDPAPPEAETVTPMPPANGRVVPGDFPDPEDDPDKALVKRLALSPNADFALDHGLSNREWAYLEQLLALRDKALQEHTAKWIAAPPSEREALIDALTLIEAQSDDAISTFFADDATFKAFRDFRARHPEREMLSAMSGELDAAGATLELDKEKQLVEALYQARVGTASIDWNSPAALKAFDEGGADERFETEWTSQTEALMGLLPKFLSNEETAAVLAARETRKSETADSISSVIKTINGDSE